MLPSLNTEADVFSEKFDLKDKLSVFQIPVQDSAGREPRQEDEPLLPCSPENAFVEALAPALITVVSGEFEFWVNRNVKGNAHFGRQDRSRLGTVAKTNSN